MQRGINGKIRSVDKDIADAKGTIEESARELGAITQETIAKNFAEGKKALEISIEKSKAVNDSVEKYTKGNGTRVAGKIKQLDKEKELLEIGKNAIDHFVTLKEEDKYEDVKQEMIVNRRYKLLATMKYVADSLDKNSKYAKSQEAIHKLHAEMVSLLKKDFVNQKELNNCERMNVTVDLIR